MVSVRPATIRLALLIALGAIFADLRPAFGAGGPLVNTAGFRLVENGFVYPNPRYRYRSNGYAYDLAPGDNDFPWIREWASTSGLWNGVDLNRDWLDREWDMMRAIIAYTESMGWTGQDSHPTGRSRRAKLQIEQEARTPEATWGCGTIAATAMGIAQAHGIPARSHAGANPNHAPPLIWSDICCSFWSTKYNKWVFFFPKCNNWFVGRDGLPMSNQEITPYDLAGLINGWDGTAEPIDGLTFMPTNLNRSNVTWITAHWWEGYFENQGISYRSYDNAENPQAVEGVTGRSIVTTAWYNSYAGTGWDVVDYDSVEFNYPQQQVQATIIQANGNQGAIELTNNMVWFDHYEQSTDNGESWTTVASPVYWTPTAGGQTLLIRGVGQAGERSRSVVIQWYPCDSNEDCNHSGAPDECEIAAGTSADCNLNAAPDECDVQLLDCNTNGAPDSCEPDADADGVPDACAGDRDGDGVPDGIDACLTPPRQSVNPHGGPRGDFDDDCVISLADYPSFKACLSISGPNRDAGSSTCRDYFDTDRDGDVDLVDFASFGARFGEP